MIKFSSLFIVLSLHFFPTCDAVVCNSSACGIIPNISSPFHLKGDSHKCGGDHHRLFELGCENNVTSFNLNSHKYYVKAINYTTRTIRLVDASISNDDICSFPTSWTYHYNFSDRSSNAYYDDRSIPIALLRCPLRLRNSSLFTEITQDCAVSSSNSTYTYIKVGSMTIREVPQMCSVDLIVMTSWLEFKDLNNVSLSEIHQFLLYGFELSWIPNERSTIWGNFVEFIYGTYPTLLLIVGLLCAMVISPPVFTIFGFAALAIFSYYHGLAWYFMIKYRYLTRTTPLTALIISTIIVATRIILFPLAMSLLIYKFRTRHLSIFDAIESFLRSDNKLAPIRYSYSDIKKMTRGFQDKLGQGGYGSVYKGKLRSGHDVAVKLLRKSGANGQDFMNEIATIGRIHHVNVVKLVGYCAEGSKRVLIFDFMPNGSLEKYLYNSEKTSSLNWDAKFEIAVGIARGIEYLHRGCDIQILHFDIKPHNILLDNNFIPKISDFGLAKFCSTDKKTVTMTVARGTIGYVAPELISRSIGAVSFKADVYSFGMLLMEMVGLNRDLKGNNGNSSQHFPYWIYDSFEKGKDIEIMEDGENGVNDNTRKLVQKMAIVALWCIQMSPDERPSMNKVLQMLESDVERLTIPDSPSQSIQTVMNVDQTRTTCFSDSVSLLHHHDASLCVEIIVQE